MGQSLPIQRFLDGDKEPTQTLVPIEGYETKELVSLDKAVEPIKQLLYNIDAMVQIARANSDESPDGLSIDESAAIHLYTMQWPDTHDSLYEILNRTLRSEKRNDLKPWFFYLKLVLTAMHKLPPVKKTIWRAIRSDVDKEYITNRTWWGFSSCSEMQAVTAQFVQSSTVRTWFKIHCINGRSIQTYSYFKNENEILLMPGTYLCILKKWTEPDGMHIIELQETKPPYQLIAPPFSKQAPGKISNSFSPSFVLTYESQQRMGSFQTEIAPVEKMGRLHSSRPMVT
jgi:hypothetical protein